MCLSFAPQVTIAYPDEGAWKRFHYQFKDEGYPEVICTKVRDGAKRIVRLKVRAQEDTQGVGGVERRLGRGGDVEVELMRGVPASEQQRELVHICLILCCAVLCLLQEGEPQGRHVVIVDDLVQSGGTLIECHALLSSLGAAHGEPNVMTHRRQKRLCAQQIIIVLETGHV